MYMISAPLIRAVVESKWAADEGAAALAEVCAILVTRYVYHGVGSRSPEDARRF